MKRFFLTLFSFVFANICFGQSVVVYPSPAANFAESSALFQVNVTQNGVTKQSFVYVSTAGTDSYTLAGRSSPEWGLQGGNRFHFTTFSFSGTITINVVKLNSTATTATIRPNTLGLGAIKTVSQGANKGVSFTLSKPAKVSVEFNDDPSFKDALMIFADGQQTAADVPNMAAANVLQVTATTNLASIPASKTIVCFNPGVYNIGVWNIPATVKQVYVAGGAYVIGYINRNVPGDAAGNSILINGRGILSDRGYAFRYPASTSDQNSNDWYNHINLNGGSITIEGVTIIESSAVNLYITGDNVNISNVNINGFRFNNDGIVSHGSGWLINNCFLRVNDDGLVPYASNVTISNCVFWQLQGSIIELGWTPHSINNFNITNCEVLHDGAQFTDNDCGFINAMNLSATSSSAAINNFNVSNIHFDTPILRLLDIRADRNNVNSAVHQLVWVCRNFKFTNIYLSQTGAATYPLMYLHGYDGYHPAVDFVFQNLYLNNVKVTPAKMNDSTFFNKRGVFGITVK